VPVVSNLFDSLLSLRAQNVELGLAAITRLLDRLDHPERDFPAVHVAGTNGKGSVCAMVAAQLMSAEYRVGLLTSPHLVHFTERIRVSGAPIQGEEAAPILEKLRNASGDYEGSFFEVTTALAFEHFRRRGVDVAVVEVGLGGRLDATNVCHPLVTAITSIDYDHTATLGPDLVSIATEKAGIVKPGVPVVLGKMAEEPRAAIEAIATRRDAETHLAENEVDLRVVESTWDGLEVAIRLPGALPAVARTPLPGRHQAENLRVAALAAHLFDCDVDHTEPRLAGLAETDWPGRLEKIGDHPVRVYDVAHNAGGAKSLADALDELGVPPGSVLLIGVLEDKDLAAMAESLSRHFQRAVTMTPPHPVRSRPARETAEILRAAGIEAHPLDEPSAAVEKAKQMCAGEGWVFVTGSLFTVGAARIAFGDPVE
jgi:dihydrofolate synthase/folylpolyglutamate synthase